MATRFLCLIAHTSLAACLTVPPKSWTAAAGFSSLAVMRPVSVVQFEGEGRHTFVHGLCSANVKEMRNGNVLDATVVDTNGHVINLMTLIDTSEAIVGLGPEGYGAAQAKFFDKYAFPADQCTVKDASDTYSCLEVAGPDAAKTFAHAFGDDVKLPDAGRCVQTGGSLVFGGGSLGYGTPDVKVYSILTASDSPAIAALADAVTSLGGIVAEGEDAWQSLRVLRGRPERGNEFDVAGSIAADSPAVPKATPFDLGLWSSVHLDKGCYLGQEVLTRLARVSKPKLGLYGVLFDAGALPGTVQQGDPVLPANGEVTDTSSLASRPVGVLTSLLEDGSTSAASFGLALVQPMQAPIGTRVSVNGATGEVVDVAYATRAGQQAGGTMAEEAPDDVPGDALAAAAAKKAAEAQRKAAKLKAMEAKMRELGLVKDDK